MGDSARISVYALETSLVFSTGHDGAAVGATFLSTNRRFWKGRWLLSRAVGRRGGEHPVAYASQKLTPTQCNWAVIEREAYAVIWALQKYKSVIWGADVKVYVDHNPLTFLVETAPKSAKLTRWLLALQEFPVKLEYKRGVEHKVPDCLSRL